MVFLERVSIRLTLLMSLPSLTGQSSIPGPWLLDRPVKPGDDSAASVNIHRKGVKRLANWLYETEQIP